MIAKSITRLALIIISLVAQIGCKDDLGQAFEDVRAAAPAVCKDYCEERISCEWPWAEGAQEDAAFSSKIRECTINCAWYMSEGGYVTEQSEFSNEIEYLERISGSTIKKVLTCVYDIGAFHCVENEDPPDTHIFEPRLETQCESTAECLEQLDIDFKLVWDESGETPACVLEGEQQLEVPFF